MKFTILIQKAIKFSIKTHEVYQKQKRKGKDVAYITHPMAVGLILARAGADEEVIAAGILHDTIEDSVDEKKVTEEMIAGRFGSRVAGIVMDVTEKDRSLPWETRKREAVRHIAHFSEDSLLVKSADVIANLSETLDDYNRFGDEVFDRFHASKERTVGHWREVVRALIERWDGNPLRRDLEHISAELEKLTS
jgi:(p)ppGpp synthase/HD superfamily hydrolase